MKKKRLWAKRTPGKGLAGAFFASHRIVAWLGYRSRARKLFPAPGIGAGPATGVSFSLLLLAPGIGRWRKPVL
ncbi:MAG: hypothetical protein H5U05_02955 [Candidatus Aminicenantes bacterium]|nr:hypothetical protein [Candidatus Aminicenantes bacterium]